MLSPLCGKVSDSTHNKEVKINTRVPVEGCNFSTCVQTYSLTAAPPKRRKALPVAQTHGERR